MNKKNKKKSLNWVQIAKKELKKNKLDDLHSKTPDGIEIKPLYTVDDLKNLEHVFSYPGIDPYLRGPKATMYPNRPWTIRQYAGFSTAEEYCSSHRTDELVAPHVTRPHQGAVGVIQTDLQGSTRALWHICRERCGYTHGE